MQAGISSGAIEVLDRTSGETTATTTTEPQSEGFWGGIKSLFAPDEDVHAYNHAVGRGHAMVMVTPSGDMDRHQIIEALERTDPVDFDARLAEWRQSGYDYSSASGTTGTTQSMPASGSVGTGAASTGVTGTGATGMASGYAAGAARTASAGLSGTDDKIEVIQERLRVGKREVAQGAVRVRSYVVERPVEEQVRLHEETVSIDRRPVDRALEPGADAFRERTIEARATAEEAVVAKEARVVEEIGIRKEAQDRTETVRDTVRETKVEVEDDRTGGARTGTGSVGGVTGASSTGIPGTGTSSTGTSSTGTGSMSTGTGSMGTGGTTTNATPGATSSGLNSPRK